MPRHENEGTHCRLTDFCRRVETPEQCNCHERPQGRSADCARIESGRQQRRRKNQVFVYGKADFRQRLETWPVFRLESRGARTLRSRSTEAEIAPQVLAEMRPEEEPGCRRAPWQWLCSSADITCTT